MKTLFKLVCISLALLLLIAGCAPKGGGDADPTKTEGSDPGGDTVKDSIVVTIENDPEALCGGFAPNTETAFSSRQIFDTLVRANPDGSYGPNLAKSWEFTNDGKDIVFELRDDVYFHNGEKMTAEDVAFSFNTIITEELVMSSTSAMENMEVVDENHVVLHMKNTYGPALECLSCGELVVFPQAYYEEDPAHFLRNPIGTGAYKFVEWKTGDKIVLEAYDKYHRGEAPIKNFTLKIFVDAGIGAMALENGEVDVLTTVLQTDLNNLRSNDKLTVSSTPSATVTYIFFNHEGIFKDKNLRLAVAHAVDKEAVLLAAMEGDGVLANCMYPPWLPGSDPDYGSYEYDVEKSKELIQEAGYELNEIKLNFRTNELERYYKPVEVLHDQLNAAGFDVSMEKMERSAWSEMTSASDFEINLYSMTLAINDFDDNYGLFYGGMPQNYSKLDMPAVNEAFDTNRNSTDPDVRMAACKDLVHAMYDEVAVWPIYCVNRSLAFNKDLKGAEAHPSVNYEIFDWSW